MIPRANSRNAKLSGDGLERLRGLRRRLNGRDAVNVQRRGGREDDEDGNQVAEDHADQRVLAGSARFGSRLPRRHVKRLGVGSPFLLDLLRCLPEEQIRADGRAEDGDEAGRERSRPLECGTNNA